MHPESTLRLIFYGHLIWFLHYCRKLEVLAELEGQSGDSAAAPQIFGSSPSPGVVKSAQLFPRTPTRRQLCSKTKLLLAPRDELGCWRAYDRGPLVLSRISVVLLRGSSAPPPKATAAAKGSARRHRRAQRCCGGERASLIFPEQKELLELS